MAAPPMGDPGERYVAHSSYTAADDGELSLAVDDVVEVLVFEEDGWWVCRNAATGREGFTPSNFLDRERDLINAKAESERKASGTSVRVDGLSPDAESEVDIDTQPTSLKEKIAILQRKSSQEHVKSPLELDGLDDLDVFTRKVEFKMLESASPTDEATAAAAVTSGGSGGSASVSPVASADSAPAGGASEPKGHPAGPAQPSAPAGQGPSVDMAVAHSQPSAAQLRDPMIQIAHTKLKSGKLRQNEFDHILRVQMRKAQADAQDEADGLTPSPGPHLAANGATSSPEPGGLVPEPSTMQMNPLRSLDDGGGPAADSRWAPNEPEYAFASGTSTAVSDIEARVRRPISGVAAGATIASEEAAGSTREEELKSELAAAQGLVERLRKELQDTRDALDAERDARDADNAASATSMGQLEEAVALAQAALAAEREARSPTSPSGGGSGALAVQRAEATARRHEAELARVKVELSHEQTDRHKVEAALRVLEASTKAHQETISDQAATIAALHEELAQMRIEQDRQSARGVAEGPSVGRVAAAEATESSDPLPRGSPLLRNPQRSRGPQRRGPSMRPTFKDALERRDTGTAHDLYSMSLPGDAPKDAPEPTAPRQAQAAALEVASKGPREKKRGKRRLPKLPTKKK